MLRAALLLCLVALTFAAPAGAQERRAPPPACGNGIARLGKCFCEPGYTTDANGACTVLLAAKNCGNGIARLGKCFCEPGYTTDANGACTVVLAAKNCGNGIFTAGQCYCLPGYAKDASGACTLLRRR